MMPLFSNAVVTPSQASRPLYTARAMLRRILADSTGHTVGIAAARHRLAMEIRRIDEACVGVETAIIAGDAAGVGGAIARADTTRTHLDDTLAFLPLQKQRELAKIRQMLTRAITEMQSRLGQNSHARVRAYARMEKSPLATLENTKGY